MSGGSWPLRPRTRGGMGVKCLLHWQPIPGERLSQQTYEDVSRAVDTLPSTRGNRWSIVCGLHRPQLREGGQGAPVARELFSVGFPSDFPGKEFLVLRHEHMVVEADKGMLGILDKLQLYRPQASTLFEGYEYSVGEFSLRLGRATSSTNELLRGIVVEVEFSATDSIDKSQPIIRDFVTMWQETVTRLALRGSFVLVEPSYRSFGLSDEHFTPLHSALQYVLCSAHFR